MSSRESAILALTASALMGVRRSYAKEGKFNKFYLVESTAWMQESFVSVLGEHASRLNIQERPSKDTSILEYITKTLFMVTKPGAAIAEGLSGKGSVNRGLKKIDRLLIPYFDKDHGDNLSVTRVYPKTKVVRGGTSTKDAIADQRRLSEGPLNGERESGLEYGTIACCKYRKANGTYAWRIIIPGTDGNHDSPMDWYTNFELMSADERQRGTAESLRFLDETMKQAGIQPDDPVEIVGHSQGGIIAAAAATDFQDKYDIQHIATLGSPIANFEIPEKTRVTAIEMDRRCLPALAELEAAFPGRLEVIQGDALKLDHNALMHSEPYSVVANLPYNVGTELFTRWLSGETWPRRWTSLTLMFQEEVARRIVAAPGTSAYGRLSVLAQWRSTARLAMKVHRSAFTPPPKVMSAVVHVVPTAMPDGVSATTLSQVTEAAFGQRRKMLRQSLKGLAGATGALDELGIDPQRRAETLSVDEFVAIARSLSV